MSHESLIIGVLIAIAVVAVLLIVVALPVVLSMRHAAKDREFQHAERLKALEMGRPLPGESPHQGSVSAAGIGVWVPIGVFGIALAASQGSIDSPAADVAIWVTAGCVGVTSVICGTILTLHNAARADRAADQLAASKPSFEEHEIDTVGRRGY